MTPKERLLTALQHREPDRVPFDLGSTNVTGIHRIAYRNLLAHLGMRADEVRVCDTVQQLAEVGEAVLQRFGVDTRGVRPRPGSSWSLELEEDEKYRHFTDEFGIRWSMPREGGLYYDMTSHPLEEVATEEEIASYPFPDPQDPARVAGLREEAERLADEGWAVVLGGPGEGAFERSLWLRGFERFFIDLVRSPSLALALLDRLVDFRLKFWELLLGEVGDLAQVVVEGDDLATQRGLMISPEMYRKYLKPRHKRIFSFIKERAPQVKIFFHTCGAVYELIPDLIEVGVDILNPVQLSAAGMDPRRLKREFGDALTFWGGGVDTQRVLPRGTPEEVKDEVKRRIEELAPGGGFVFATVHNIQADVPPENILAMWEALQEYGKY